MESNKTISPNNLSKLFANTKILDPIKNEKIIFKELWENNDKRLILIYWLRRFGCPLCRMGALDLTTALLEYPDEIKNKINYVAVGLSSQDYEDFIEGNYFKNGPVLIDEEKETYKALKFATKGIFSLFGALNFSNYYKAIEATKRGITGTMRGDGLQLGGCLIIKNNGDVVYSFAQKTYADQPNIEEVLQTIAEN